MRQEVVTVATIAGLLALVNRMGQPQSRLAPTEVRALVNGVLAREGWRVAPCMIMAMVEIESARDPNASRFEAHRGESSLGLMQVLPSTARWLFGDMGYKRYQPTEANLRRPEISIYFGAAFVRWLSTYAGQDRSERWIVES